MNPLVTIVVPCYNAEQWIARSVRSCLGQRNIKIEIIVIDDGSTDKSIEVVQSFGNRIKWESGPRRGACLARNSGLDLANTEFILFLDADDYIEPDSINEWAIRCAEADLVLGPFAYEIAGRRTVARFHKPEVTADYILCQWLEGSFTPPCSVLWRRSFLLAIGGWDVNALRNQDGELTMRALLNGARVSVADRGMGVYVQHQNANRVSKRRGHEVCASELSSLDHLWCLAQKRRRAGMRQSFAKAFYRLAYDAFATGVNEIGDLALSRARQMGLKGHPGTFSHQTLSAVLGLRRKLQLTGLIKGRSSF
jgi:glycosyltransferase involved in cell wall biosynthesis